MAGRARAAGAAVIRGGGRRASQAMTAAALLNTVRAHGLRVSSARRCVLEALFAAARPLTAEEVAGDADVASVYRNLETLEAIGIVRHVHLGHGPGRYALAARSGGWATCEACGSSTPLDPHALRAIRRVILEAAGFDAGFTHFPIVRALRGLSRITCAAP
jgi:Fur family ferric uptake transcriptional regulator